jgi:hypothetical protein
MSWMNTFIRGELRVAFSPRAHPVWLRIIKWTAILVGAALFHRTPWFWGCLAGLALARTFMHFIYRWKTRVCSRPWGGWNDLSAGRD